MVLWVSFKTWSGFIREGKVTLGVNFWLVLQPDGYLWFGAFGKCDMTYNQYGPTQLK